MLAAHKASPESPHPIGPTLQSCSVSGAAIGSLPPVAVPAGGCSPLAADGAPGMPCAGAARGPAGPGHGGGGARSGMEAAGERGGACQGLCSSRGCGCRGAGRAGRPDRGALGWGARRREAAGMLWGGRCC